MPVRQGEIPTRSEIDERYAQINRASTKRIHFRYISAWTWLQENHPEIADAIREESFRRWPSEEQKPRQRSDLSFLRSLKERPNAQD